MKKTLFILAVSLTVFIGTTTAQPPTISTADDPVWYYIQVIGKGEVLKDRVFTVTGNYLYGKILSLTNDAQLFRFENTGNQYKIISKSANKKVDIGLKDGEGILTLSQDGSNFNIETTLQFFYNIIAEEAPQGGDYDKKYTCQTDHTESYRISLTDNSLSEDENTCFSFVPYDALKLEYSTSTEDFYYYIINAKAGKDTYLTDITSTGGNIMNFSLEKLRENDDSQQWKIVKKSENDSKVEFVNKATANVILTSSHAKEFYNYTLFSKDMNQSNGWSLSYVNPGQYTISGIEEDNIKRFWSFTDSSEIPEKYKNENLAFSPFAWKLKSIKSNTVNTLQIHENKINVYSINRIIYVKGNDNFTVRNIQGIQMNKQEELSPGIYIVSVENQSVKILIK